jgi:UDP-N-acetylglucosamine:LPS N-acetylglucosamine transferase
VQRIVIVSARIGAGHDGAAHALAAGLSGYDVELVDFLDLLPGTVGSRLCGLYHRQLDVSPRSWEWTLGALNAPWLARLVSRASALACARLREVTGEDTALAISTYPLASHALVALRRRGELAAPVAVYLTDPSVHRLCVSPGAELHVAPNLIAREQAWALGAGTVEVAAPAVSKRFHVAGAAGRLRAREQAGLPQAGRLALVVAGSWGVGEVRQTAHDVIASGAATPVVVCGRNTALRNRLNAEGLPHVFGWVGDMPRLMRAVDVVVQNAGGLTTSEALAAGRPVFTYRCLPGHGRANAEVLDTTGVVPWIRTPADLAMALRTGRPPAAGALPAEDPVPLLEKLLDTR